MAVERQTVDLRDLPDLVGMYCYTRRILLQGNTVDDIVIRGDGLRARGSEGPVTRRSKDEPVDAVVHRIVGLHPRVGTGSAGQRVLGKDGADDPVACVELVFNRQKFRVSVECHSVIAVLRGREGRGGDGGRRGRTHLRTRTPHAHLRDHADDTHDVTGRLEEVGGVTGLRAELGVARSIDGWIRADVGKLLRMPTAARRRRLRHDQGRERGRHRARTCYHELSYQPEKALRSPRLRGGACQPYHFHHSQSDFDCSTTDVIDLLD